MPIRRGHSFIMKVLLSYFDLNEKVGVLLYFDVRCDIIK
jgi:hypothetical protein